MEKEKFCGLFGPQDRREQFEGKKGEQMREKLLHILRRVSSMGIHQFGCCYGIGFQLLAGEAILQLKEEDDSIRLVFSMPEESQNIEFWTQAERKRHQEIFFNADHVSYHPNLIMTTGYASAEEYLLRQVTHAIVCYSPENLEDAGMLRIMDFFAIPQCNLAQMNETEALFSVDLDG